MKKDPTENNQQLGNLLERYKKIFKPPQASVEKEVIAITKAVCGILLQPHQITYNVSSKAVIIKAPSLLRSELLLHRTAILEGLRDKLGESTAPKTIL